MGLSVWARSSDSEAVEGFPKTDPLVRAEGRRECQETEDPNVLLRSSSVTPSLNTAPSPALRRRTDVLSVDGKHSRRHPLPPSPVRRVVKDDV